ncbi:MAG TPA: DUF4366 domain-containing protein [Fusobacterium sp.]|uniref:CD1107 family mobile element protein n=1 Tax=Fusobacterium sp. TaxID=68766 RepID=UPI002F3F7AA6
MKNKISTIFVFLLGISIFYQVVFAQESIHPIEIAEEKNKRKLNDEQKDNIRNLEKEIEELEKRWKEEKDKISSEERKKMTEELRKKIVEFSDKLNSSNQEREYSSSKVGRIFSPLNSTEILKSLISTIFSGKKENPKLPEQVIVKSPVPIQTEKKEPEIRYPNKLTPKTPPNNNQETSRKNVNTNKGIASKPSKARASVMENKDNTNQNYPIYRGGGNKKVNKYSADARQFITFQTKSGKTFHLIINHDEKNENVMLLTEASEDDLLNMVEGKDKTKEIKKMEEVVPKKKIKNEEPKKEEKKGNGAYFLLGIIMIGVIGVGYYFKIYKKKREEGEEEEYDELEDDYENENNSEDGKESDRVEENTEIEDMAIDSYDEEEEE